MKKLFIFLPVIFFFFSCSKKMNKQSKVVLDTQVYILLTNQQGENLLDPETPGAYNNNDIYIYTLNKDGTQKILQKDLVRTSKTVPYFLYLNEFNLSRPDKNGFGEPTVYLHLNDQTTDTVKVEITVYEAVTYISKVWYNGELKWTTGNKDPIKIVK